MKNKILSIIIMLLMFSIATVSVTSNPIHYTEWDGKIFVDETSGKHDYIILGEKKDASELLDSYDVPKCPPPPYTFIYFYIYNEDMPYPYDYLWYEYRDANVKVRKDFEICILCMVEDPTNITLNWDKHVFMRSGYKYVSLYDDDGNILANMKSQNSYTYPSDAYSYSKFHIKMEPKVLDYKMVR